MRVLVLEDDEILSIEIKKFLILKNFDVVCITDGEDAVCHIGNTNFDLYIIDIYVPNINGLDIVKFIRKVDIFTPIVIITASFEINNFTQAFKYGCNEYIRKPFHFSELEIRIDKLLDTNLDCIRFSDTFVYQKDKNLFLSNGEIIQLRKKEKRFLEILMKNINKTVSKDIIIDYVWEYEIKESYTLRQLVNGIRKKLPIDIIKTDISVGYSLTLKR